MAPLYNRTYNRREILSRVGDISQIARIKPYRLEEGQEDGVQALDVGTGSGIVNEACHFGDATDRGLGVYVTFRPEQLPRFIEWKMMDAGTYVAGMEPANWLIMGRAKEREAGTLQFLEPAEKREYSLEIGALVGSSSIAVHERQCPSAVRSVGVKWSAP